MNAQMSVRVLVLYEYQFIQSMEYCTTDITGARICTRKDRPQENCVHGGAVK